MAADCAGLRIVVSAGPTFEDIDPVRFIGNRSSGRMGFAVAAAAAARGADVVLVSGPVALPTPPGVARRIDVRSAAGMHAAVHAALPADVYVGAAAVADFRPRAVAAAKIKKQGDDAGMVLELVRTRDILADVAAAARRPRLVVGFAAETEDLAANARAKLARKGVDMIAANRVGIAGSGFESEDNAITLYWPDGSRALAPGPKSRLASELVDAVLERLPA